ncbi:MAG: DUF4340 domain-containing protein [Aristaeellaceae bacterium]
MKRSIKLLLLALVLALCVGGYFGVQQFSQTQQVIEEAGTFDLTAKVADDLTGLKWTSGETTFDLTWDGSAWQRADDAAFPLDQDAAQDMADALLALTATRKIENVTSPADYGLAEPAFSVTARWKDGTETTYAMGDQTPFADGYYLQLSGQDTVIYTISKKLNSLFETDMNALAVLESIPEVENVTRLTVGDTLDLQKASASRTINPDQLWYSADGEPVDGADDLVETAQDIAWDELVTASATQDELTAWQLDGDAAIAISLYDGDEAGMTVLLGTTNDDGNYYARLPESSMVYTVSATDVSSLLTATAEEMRSETILSLPYEQVKTATLTAGSTVYVLEHPAEDSQPEEGGEDAAADAEASEAPEATAEPEEDPGEDIWALVLGLDARGVPEAEAGELVLTIQVVSAEGMEATLTIAEYDASYYQLTMGGRKTLVSADEVDKLVRQVKQLAR